MNKDIILSLEHVSKCFGSGKLKTYALKDVSFSLYEGEVLGLVGESGSGKTTLAKCIVSPRFMDQGEITFLGKRIETQGKKTTYLPEIQMIFQDPIASLDPRMTIYDIVAEGLYIQGLKDKKEIDRRVNEALHKVSLLEEHKNRYPNEFSGGQRQRIGIARALIMEPKLLVADEILSALDVSIQAQMINLLNDLKKSMSLSMIFITHNLSLARYFCDQIAIMYQGEVVEKGDTESIFLHPQHPYTQRLLSFILEADPNTEKEKETKEEKIVIETKKDGKKRWVEVEKNHFVLMEDGDEEKS